jgi:Flp pilus assembly protein TadG
VFCGNRRNLKDESGQVIVMSLIAMVILLAMTGFAVDFGHAYLVQRQLQAATDAAVLAGALELPTEQAAKDAVNDFGPQVGSANELTASDNSGLTVTMRCIQSAPGCAPGSGKYNAINVQSTSTVNTVFTKLVGLDSLKVHASATACSPCKGKPLDIMLVVDRTGSMCQITDPNDPTKVIPDPYIAGDASNGIPALGNPAGCTDLVNAKNGMKTFLQRMDPTYDHVGLAIFPPASSLAANCAAPASYNTATPTYTVVPLSSDYASSPGNLVNTSNLVSTIDCIRGGGSTAYARAIESAEAELNSSRARPGVQKVIIFLSDGAANTGPASAPLSYRQTPCHQGINSASVAKDTMNIYTIGYDLDGGTNTPEQCRDGITGGLEQPSITSLAAMQGIASPNSFYQKNDPGSLTTIFNQIAADIFRTAQLIDDNAS